MSDTAPANVETAANTFAAWFHETYPYLSLTQEVFDVIATTLRSLNIPVESVSADNYRSAFVLAVSKGLITMPASPADIEKEKELARLKKEYEDAEAERKLEERRKERQRRLEAEQLARYPGIASVHGNRDERAKGASEEAQAREAVRNQAEKNLAYAAFRQELSNANSILITMKDGSQRVMHGATDSARAAAKKSLAEKYRNYPEFLKELR